LYKDENRGQHVNININDDKKNSLLSSKKEEEKEVEIEEEDNDTPLNLKPININTAGRVFDSFPREDVSRSIPININRKKKYRNTKYSSSYVELSNIKDKEGHDSHESLSSSFPEYVSSSISFSKQIEMMDIQSISKLSKENILNHQQRYHHSGNSFPTNSLFSEKSIPQTPGRSFVSRSSKHPSLFTKANSFTSKVSNKSPSSVTNNHFRRHTTNNVNTNSNTNSNISKNINNNFSNNIGKNINNNINNNISSSISNSISNNNNNNNNNINSNTNSNSNSYSVNINSNVNIDHQYSNDNKKNKKKEKLPSQSDIILCIQMQLCQATLFDYLQDRNKLLNESSDLVDDKGYPLIDEEENYHIWCDIIEGVKYIHSKGLIHR